MAKQKQRIIEAYCWRPIKRVKNPLGHKQKQVVTGGCVVGLFEPKTSKVEWFGVGTAKIIPDTRKGIKEISRMIGKKRSIRQPYYGGKS